MSELVERLRAALVEAALRAHEEAGVRGLCAEGRWEAAIDSMRSLELDLPEGHPEEPAASPAAPPL